MTNITLSDPIVQSAKVDKLTEHIDNKTALVIGEIVIGLVALFFLRD